MVNKLWPANRKERRHLGAAAYVWRRDYKIKVEPKKTQTPEEGFLRGQNKRTGLVFNINSSWYVRASGASFPFPVCICDATQCNAMWDLICFYIRPLPDIFVYTVPLKVTCVFWWSLFVDLCSSNWQGVCMCESVSVTQACRGLTWWFAFLTSTVLASFFFFFFFFLFPVPLTWLANDWVIR